MTDKHASPEWRRTVRIVRAQVRQAWARGDEVTCWRCGGLIEERTAYDVGHLNPHGGEGIENAAPEHRHENRSHGGRIGARVTNTRKQAKTTGLVTPTWA